VPPAAGGVRAGAVPAGLRDEGGAASAVVPVRSCGVGGSVLMIVTGGIDDEDGK